MKRKRVKEVRNCYAIAYQKHNFVLIKVCNRAFGCMLKNFEFYVFLHAVHTLLNLKKHNENLKCRAICFLFFPILITFIQKQSLKDIPRKICF